MPVCPPLAKGNWITWNRDPLVGLSGCFRMTARYREIYSTLRFPVASIVTLFLAMVRKKRQSLWWIPIFVAIPVHLSSIFTNQAVSSRKMPSRSSCMKSSPPMKQSTKRYHQSSPAMSDPTSKIYTEQEESGPKFLAKSTAIVSFPWSFVSIPLRHSRMR